MLTLGIETSCDETSCAVLFAGGRDGSKVLSNIVSSSLFRHQPFGGVVPEIASRHCLEQIDFVFQEALSAAKVKARALDLIAVTHGPGLIGSLLVGVSFAKALAYRLKIPLIGVNHLEAHLSANFIGKTGPKKFVGLLVSGGHTSLSFHQNGKVTLLGATVDDAAGEAYDKVAKLLGLGYPGGPAMDRLAAKGNPKKVPFTEPKQKGKFDFSFSGIKTAVLYAVQKQKCHPEDVRSTDEGSRRSFANAQDYPLPSAFIRDMAASFQEAVVKWLVKKTLAAADDKKVRDIVAGGGVSANSALRKSLTEEGAARGLNVWFPPGSLTTDNAAMIARRGLELYKTKSVKREQNVWKMTGLPNLAMGEV